jgi:tRNA modification GTPase
MLGDTIVARASAAGSSERAVLRVSGPRAFATAARVFAPALPAERATVDGAVTVLGQPVAAFALVMPGPRSFTGEDVVELHVPGGMLLVQHLLDAMLADGEARGVRLALPGEFTARALQHGKLAPAAVEGLLLLLHAANARDAAAGVSWLRDGAREVDALRAGLQDVLALLEGGLDFGDGEAGAVAIGEWRAPLTALHARLAALGAALPAAAPGGEVLLLGRANAGKSSLANALAGRAQALVDAVAGTTRDLLRIELPDGGVVWDAPGDLDEPAAADAAALALRDRLGGGAAAALVVLDAAAPAVPASVLATALPWLAVVWTKGDVQPPPPLPAELAARAAGVPVFATSVRTGEGIAALRAHLARSTRAGVVDAGGPLRGAVLAAALAVERALAAAAPELVAVDLQGALRAFDAIAGPHSAEQLLDRIYARFCLGK